MTPTLHANGQNNGRILYNDDITTGTRMRVPAAVLQRYEIDDRLGARKIYRSFVSVTDHCVTCSCTAKRVYLLRRRLRVKRPIRQPFGLLAAHVAV